MECTLNEAQPVPPTPLYSTQYMGGHRLYKTLLGAGSVISSQPSGIPNLNVFLIRQLVQLTYD